MMFRAFVRKGFWGPRVFLASLLAQAAAPVSAEEISIEFSHGPGEVRFVQFDDFSGTETWYMTRCQNAVSADYYVIIREYGDVEQIQPVNSPLEADKTVCVVGHIFPTSSSATCADAGHGRRLIAKPFTSKN